MRVIALIAATAFAVVAVAASAKRPITLPLSTRPHPDPLKRTRWTLGPNVAAATANDPNVDPNQSLVPIFTGSGEFYATIGLGTPAQPMTVILDSGSATLAVPAAGCVGCTVPGAFDPTKSATVAQMPCSSPQCTGGCAVSSQAPTACGFGVEYADTSAVWGALMTDVLTVGSLSAPGISFGLFWNAANGFQTPPAQGIMGLAYKTINCNPNTVPASHIAPANNGTGTCNPVSITSLLAYHALPNVFSLCMATNSSTAGLPAGVMTLGGYDPLYFSGDIRWTPVIQQSFYAVQMFDLQVNGVSVQLPFYVYNDFGTIVDSGTTDLVLAEPSFTALRNATRQALAAFSNGASNGCDFFVECCAQSLFPNAQQQNAPLGQPLQLGLQLSGVLLTLPLNGYLSCGANAGCNPGSCTMNGIVPGAQGGGIIIGQTVLQYYTTIFDRSTPPQVGFAPATCTRTCDALTSGGCASCTASPSCAWCNGACVSADAAAAASSNNATCLVGTCQVPTTPQVAQLVPSSGAASGGNVLLLVGTAMENVAAVYVDGQPAQLFALGGGSGERERARGGAGGFAINTTAVIVPPAVDAPTDDSDSDNSNEAAPAKVVAVTARFHTDAATAPRHVVGQYTYQAIRAAPATQDDLRATKTLSVVAIVLSLLALAAHATTAVRGCLRERERSQRAAGIVTGPALGSSGDERHRELLS